MAKLLKRGLPVLLVAVFFVMPATRSGACPFCNQEGKTLTAEVKDATMVLYGELKNAQAATDKTDKAGTPTPPPAEAQSLASWASARENASAAKKRATAPSEPKPAAAAAAAATPAQAGSPVTK